MAARQGAERMVYHCSEMDAQGQLLGPRLVAKQILFKELMHVNNFHSAFCRMQGEAQALAALFNRCGPAGPRPRAAGRSTSSSA